MHDQEVGIVDIELYGLEEVLDGLLLRTVAIDEVLACTSEHDLARDRDLAIFFEANGGLLLVSVVENNGNAGFGDASLASFVD